MGSRGVSPLDDGINQDWAVSDLLGCIVKTQSAAADVSTIMCGMPRNTAEGGCATTYVEDIVRRVSSRGFERQIRPIPYRTGPYASVSRNMFKSCAVDVWPDRASASSGSSAAWDRA